MGGQRIRSALRLAVGFAPALLLCVAPASADTIIPGGTVINQTWTAAGSPYIVEADVSIPPGAYLDIEPGTIVQFFPFSDIKLTVEGTITIPGTTANPVHFEGKGDFAGSWHGLVILPSATTAVLTHLTIRDASVAIEDDSGILDVSYLNIELSSVGLRLPTGSPSVRYVTVSGAGTSSGIAIHVLGTAAVTLDSFTVTGFSNGSGARGVQIESSLPSRIVNCVIANSDVAITVSYAAAGATVINCTLDHNAVGFEGEQPNASPNTVRNTIFSTNTTAAVQTINFQGATTISFSDDWHNASPVNVSNVTAGPGNLVADPRYVAPPDDFHLSPSSACIDAGAPTDAPDHDRDGNARPVDGNGIPDSPSEFDMGAYEFGPPPTVTTSTTTTTATSTTTTTLAGSSKYQAYAQYVDYKLELIIAGSVDGVQGTGERFGISHLVAAAESPQETLASTIQPEGITVDVSGLDIASPGYVLNLSVAGDITANVPIPSVGGGSIGVRLNLLSYAAQLPAVMGRLSIFSPTDKYLTSSILAHESLQYQLTMGEMSLAPISLQRDIRDSRYVTQILEGMFPTLTFDFISFSKSIPVLQAVAASIDGHDVALDIYLRIDTIARFDTSGPPTPSTTSTTTTLIVNTTTTSTTTNSPTSAPTFPGPSITTTTVSIAATSTTVAELDACVVDAQVNGGKLRKVVAGLGRRLAALRRRSQRDKRLSPACRDEVNGLLQGVERSLLDLSQ